VFIVQTDIYVQGLVIYLLQTYWPSLLRLPGFLQEFVTPVIKATKTVGVKRKKVAASDDTIGNPNSHSFFSIPEFLAWEDERRADGTLHKFTTKYYNT